MENEPVKLLFVCLGNICRSPTGRGRDAPPRRRSRGSPTGSSSTAPAPAHGTSATRPTGRSTAAAAARGITLDGRARGVDGGDFEHYDLILAMDTYNLRDLQAIAPTDEAEAKVRMLREFDPMTTPDDYDVPDPYYGGPDGFDHVIDLVEAACRGLLDEVLAGTAP